MAAAEMGAVDGWFIEIVSVLGEVGESVQFCKHDSS